MLEKIAAKLQKSALREERVTAVFQQCFEVPFGCRLRFGRT